MIQKGDLDSNQNCNFSTMKNTAIKIAYFLVSVTQIDLGSAVAQWLSA